MISFTSSWRIAFLAGASGLSILSAAIDPDNPEGIRLSPVCWPASGGLNYTLIFRNQHPGNKFNNIDLNYILTNYNKWLCCVGGFSTRPMANCNVL